MYRHHQVMEIWYMILKVIEKEFEKVRKVMQLDF